MDSKNGFSNDDEVNYMLENLSVDKLCEEAAFTDSSSYDSGSLDNHSTSSETSFIEVGNESATETIAQRKAKPQEKQKNSNALDSVWLQNDKKRPEKIVAIKEPEKLSKDAKESKSRNPFSFIKELKGTKKPKAPRERVKVDYSNINIYELPQAFVTKYLGYKPTDGLHGLKHVRKQIDQLILEAQESKLIKNAKDLPIVQVTVRVKGVQLDLHSISENKDFKSDAIQTQYISYAVQDTKYARVVALIQVVEMSAKHTTSVVHAFICDTPVSARKLTVSVSLAFTKFTERIGENPELFKVDLTDKNITGLETIKRKSEHDV